MDGHAKFTDCANLKTGDDVPGRGGAIYNGIPGSIRFQGGVTMQDMFFNVRLVVCFSFIVRTCRRQNFDREFAHFRGTYPCALYAGIKIGLGTKTGCSQH